MYLLKKFWEEHDRFWVTFNKLDSVSLLENEKNIGVIFLQIEI
ncbi:Polysaccharide biosynthesis protein, putative glycosyl transferase enhancer [Clostridium chauvoei JF4335]|nr:Polysaccharide biosynthesis protein, putative glycosyl transferase enhancer [Clostridium chauvoei JF4335]